VKHTIDIQVVLATVDDMDFWDERASEAMDRLNTILHMLYDKAHEDINSTSLENMIQYIWENWREDAHLLDIDEVDLYDWVDQLLSTWDDEHQEPR
jgi:hypothetical protein